MSWFRRTRRSTSPLRIALLGAGGAAGIHGLAARSGGHRVVAVASGELALAAARAGETGGEPMEVDELVDRAAELADVVVVTAPVEVRAELVMRLLDPLRHPAGDRSAPVVLVEPVLCATLAEADAVVAASEAAGGRLCYGEHLLHAPVVGGVLDRLPAIGALTHLEVVTIGAGRDEHAAALVDLGPRAVALALAAAGRLRLGPPIEVMARAEAPRAVVGDAPGDVTVELRFAGDRVLQLRIGHRSDGTTMWHVQAAGATGVVRGELLPFPSLDATGSADRGAMPRRDDDTVVALGYAAQLDASGRAKDPGAQVWRPDAVFGRDVLDVVSAACRSLGREGTPTPLPYVGPRGVEPHALLRGG